MRSEIKRWGNSAAVRLASRVLAQAHLGVTSPITITVEHGKIVIEPATKTPRRVKLPFSETELLKGLTADTAHADELAPLTLGELEV